MSSSNLSCHLDRPSRRHPCASYRNRWLDALLIDTQVEAVVSFGHLARSAFEGWQATASGAQSQVTFEHLTHPTMPEASSKGDPAKKATATKKMLAQYNAALTRLDAQLGERDVDRELIAYGDELLASDRSPIPAYDLPAGAPPWWSSVKQWAARKGDTAEEKRATIEVVVPTAERPWR